MMTTRKTDPIVLITLFVSFLRERAPWVLLMQQWQQQWHALWHFNQLRQGRHVMLVQLQQQSNHLNHYVNYTHASHRQWSR
jgi:hypothetical protein